MCAEKRRTPLKSAESTVPYLPINRKGVPSDLAHITPSKHAALTEPWTPTANLKMLISAASPDIRDREMKKVLFRPIENDTGKPTNPGAVVEDLEVEDSGQVCKREILGTKLNYIDCVVDCRVCCYVLAARS